MNRTSKLPPSHFADRVLSAHGLMIQNENGDVASFKGLHASAIQSFEQLGFPSRRSEAWKYTPVTKWLTDDLEFERPDGLGPVDLPDWLRTIDGYVAVSTDGVFRPELSRLPTDDSAALVMGLSEAVVAHGDLVMKHLGAYAPHKAEVFPALNTAFVKNGLFVLIRSGQTLDKPLFVTDIPTGSRALLRQPRNLYIAESLSSGMIIEYMDKADGCSGFENSVTEIVVGSGARVKHGHVFDRGEDSSLVNSTYVYQDKDSYFSTNHVTLTGSLVRHNLNFLPDAEGCETHLLGLVAARGHMHVDIHSFVDHAKPNAFSNELYKCILDEHSTGVFNGKVMVRQDAQLINAYQSNRCILLSEDARMYSKPELEIYADDVKCSHGATTGQLDDDAIFYLRSRGLREQDARLLLLQSFAAEVLDEIGVAEIAERLMDRLKDLVGTSQI